MKQFLIAVRESLGLSESDTESTFDGWETCLLLSKQNQRPYTILRCDETRKLYEYCRSLDRNEGFYRNYQMMRDGVLRCSNFIEIVSLIYPDEVSEWPLWLLNSSVPRTLKKWGVKGHYRVTTHLPGLFDKIIEDLFDGRQPTIDELELFANGTEYRELTKKVPWLPVRSKLLYRDHTPFNDMWEFISAFQEHYSEDEFVFKEEDYKIRINEYHGKRALTDEDCRYWFFNYLCEEYSIMIDQDTFPENSSNHELQQVISITADMINKVRGSGKVCVKYTKKQKRHVLGIRKLVKFLWPNYKLEKNLWNRMKVTEKRMNDMIERVLNYYGYDYEYYETLFIPTRTGRYAKYAHSGKEMKVDGFCRALNLIVEGQGDYHYIDRTHGVERWDGSNWESRIPLCYNGNATTYLEYRQESDAKKRRAIKRHGFDPVYVVLSRWGHAVKGVHGDIPMWNFRYVTGKAGNANSRPSYSKSIGLAEIFDMQGRKDVGDMIRNYYHNVLKMTKEMKRKLEE